VCLRDHAAYKNVLGGEDVVHALRGKTVVQFTTDTAEQAEQFGVWASERGIDVLEAAILAYPEEIATERSLVVYAGSADDYERTAPIRDALGGRSFHVGVQLSAASVVDASVLGLFYGSAMSYLQGVELCARQGVSVEVYSQVKRAWLPALASVIESAVVNLVPAAQIPLIEKNDNLKLLISKNSFANYYGMNVEHAPFNDVRVRQALKLALDRDQIVKNVASSHRGSTKLSSRPVPLHELVQRLRLGDARDYGSPIASALAPTNVEPGECITALFRHAPRRRPTPGRSNRARQRNRSWRRTPLP
jgi:hypothetical protein